MNKNFNEVEFCNDIAARGGRDALENVRKTLERTMQEIDGYIAQYETKESAYDKADVLNWTIGYLTNNVLGNCRIDILAMRQADLKVAHDLKRRADREAE